MRKITRIIVHCSATRPDWMADQPLEEKGAEIRRWHTLPKPKGRGWADIGYHFLIDRDGSTMVGRPVENIGAHVVGHNVDSIGICLIGGHGSSSTDKFLDNFTQEQYLALRELCADLMDSFGPLTIKGHNEYAAKACPGFQVRPLLRLNF